MRKKKLRVILSLILMIAMVLSPMQVSAKEIAENIVLAEELAVTNRRYFGSFTIAKNESKQINVSVLPKKTSNKELKWTSSDASIVEVSKTGLIKGLREGNAQITVSTTDGTNLSETIEVTVGTPVTKVKANVKKLKLVEGKSAKIKASVTPKNASIKDVDFKSADTTIATVDQDGTVHGIAKGKTTISATAKDGSGKRALIYVTVKGVKADKTLTDADVVDGKITLSDAYIRNLKIDSSVGDAQIHLDNVKVRGSLEMSSDAEYVVHAKNSEINKVIALEEKEVVPSDDKNTSDDSEKEISSFATLLEDSKEANLENSDKKKTPTFVASEGTIVVEVDARDFQPL